MGDNRTIVYREGDTWVYRASAIGRSLRCLAAARQGYDPLDPPSYLLKAAEAGDMAEIKVKAELRARGYRISGEQATVELVPVAGTLIRGHLDSAHCLDPEGRDRILEVKSMSARVFDTWIRYGFEKFPTYAAQISVYMASKLAQATYAVINRDTQDLDIRTIVDYPVPIREIVQKVALSEYFATKGTLPVCDSASEYACPYEYLCDRREMLFEELEVGSEDRLERLGDQHEEVKALIAELTAKKDALRDEIQVAMAGRKKVQTGRYGFTFDSRTRRSLDLVMLRGEMGDELDRFFKDEEGKPFLTVKRRGPHV